MLNEILLFFMVLHGLFELFISHRCYENRQEVRLLYLTTHPNLSVGVGKWTSTQKYSTTMT